MQIKVRSVFERARGTLETGKVLREVDIEMLKRGDDQSINAIGVFELASNLTTRGLTMDCIISDGIRMSTRKQQEPTGRRKHALGA